MRIRSVIATVAALVVSGLCRPGLAQTFDVITAPGAGQSARAVGVSADGSVVGGAFAGGGSEYTAFTWTRSGGRVDIGPPQGFSGVDSTAFSGDGTTLVGLPAFRYRGPGTYQPLGTLGPYPNAWANGVNGDGNVIAGEAFNSSGTSGEAWRWTPSGGMQGLGRTRAGHTYSNAQAVSRDGNVIVGWSGSQTPDAFVWTAPGGMQILTPNAGSQTNQATAVNHDGSYIAGTSGFATIWHQGTTTPLPQLQGWATMIPHAISDDGSIVAGQARNPSFEQEAWIWTQGRGSESLLSYLTFHGVSVPAGWRLDQVNGLSADGTTIVGRARTGLGLPALGFVATVPTPGVCVTICAALCATSRRRRATTAT